VANKLGVERWEAALPTQFTLPVPAAHELSPWLSAFERWHVAFSGPLGALERCTLECLLEAEAHVESALRERLDPGDAPAAAAAPLSYRTRVEGSERPRQRRLHWWDRFLTADGWVPGLGRLAVAGAIVASVLGFGGAAQSATLVIYNGLSATVDVRAGELQVTLAPASTTTLEVAPIPELSIETRCQGALVEAFLADASTHEGAFVYNVASASPLLEWTAAYGNASEVPEKPLGAPRWSTSRADVLFAAPPRDVRTRGGGATRRVLRALDEGSAMGLSRQATDDGDRERMIAAHARWDSASSQHVLEWLELAQRSSERASIVRDRLAHAPRDVVALRAELDGATAAERQDVCARHRALARADAADVNLQYVAARCIEAEAERDEWFVSHHALSPKNPWLANAAGTVLSDRREWAAASRALSTAARLPALRDRASLRLARVLRVAPEVGALPARVDAQTELGWLEGLEAGAPPKDDPYGAYGLLAKGSLREAIDQASSEPQLWAKVQRFAAASDGAPRELVERAMRLSPEAGLDGESVFASVALARREQKPIEPFKAAFERAAGQYAAALWPLLEQPAAFDEALQRGLVGLPLELQGEAYVMGAVSRGASAPRAWRDMARALLFASERPYFEP
jgi:hypothetical protein